MKEVALGELIELTEEQNLDLKYGVDDVRGMAITKEVIPIKADLDGTDLSNFRIVEPKHFVYNPRTHGKRIGLAFNLVRNPQAKPVERW